MRSISVTVGTSPTLLVAADDTHREIYLHVVGIVASATEDVRILTPDID